MVAIAFNCFDSPISISKQRFRFSVRTRIVQMLAQLSRRNFLPGLNPIYNLRPPIILLQKHAKDSLEACSVFVTVSAEASFVTTSSVGPFLDCNNQGDSYDLRMTKSGIVSSEIGQVLLGDFYCGGMGAAC